MLLFKRWVHWCPAPLVALLVPVWLTRGQAQNLLEALNTLSTTQADRP